MLKAKEREQVIDTESMTIDIGAKSKEDAQGAVKIGDYATFATEFAEMGDGLVKGKALDDRTGCSLLSEILKRDYPFDLFGVFTVQEEGGRAHRRTRGRSPLSQPAFVLECTTCDDSPKTRDLPTVTRMNGGPAITLTDNSTIADKRLVKLLIETAKENRIPYELKQTMNGGTDAGHIHLTKEGVPSAVVSVPTRYFHSAVALLSLQDYQNTLALMTKTLPKLGKGLGG